MSHGTIRFVLRRSCALSDFVLPSSRRFASTPESATKAVVEGPPSDLALTTKYSQEIPLSTGRPKLCILGTGWAAARLLRDIDPKAFDLIVCSLAPSKHGQLDDDVR